MAEQGYVLDIDTKFIERLKKADEALDKFVKSTDKLSRQFDELASGGLTKFAALIDRITGSVTDLSRTKVGDLGFTEASNIVSKTVDNVNNAVKSINNIVENRVSEAITDTPMLIDTKALEKEVSALDAAIKKTKEKRAAHTANLKALKKADSAPSKIRDVQAAVETDEKNLARLRRNLKSVQEELEKATANNKAALERMLAQSVEGFIPIGAIKANINELNKMIHEVPSLYPDPVEQQRVVDQLIALKEKYKDAMKSSGQKFDEVEKERIAQQKIVQIAEAADEREAASNKKKAQQIVDNFIKETEAARKSYEDRRQMYTSLWDEQEHEARTTFSGAMEYSKETKTINEQIQALKYLKEARGKLDKSTMSEDEYKQKVKELTDEYARQKTELDKLTGKHAELKKEHHGLLNTAEQLKRAFSGMFAISAIRGYVNQLMKVRGEFELQQRALTAIVKNKAQANEVWKQTIALAVKSPFSVQEMVTSTKQLAAYRVETEKLVETNKMLSDISAGVGVDMSRLILAFGQVKAANYLRGTELRQFSEAGVNILDELAKHFTALEGTAVSVGDVFERVSKRMVSFADVETVLKNVTSAGGAFYRMQEVQSETLRGQISNLKDSISLMYNEIGSANDFMLKGAVSTTRFLVENWKAIARALEVIIVIVSANKLTSFITEFNEKTESTAGLWEALGETIKGSFKSAKNFFANLNPAALGASVAIAAISAAVTELIRHRQALKEIRREVDNIRLSLDGVALSFNKALNAKQVGDMREQLLQLATLLKNEFDVDNILPDGDVLKAMNAEQLEYEFVKIRQLIIDMTDDYAELAGAADAANSRLLRIKGAGVAGGVVSWWQLASDTLEGDLEDYSETAQKTYEAVRNSYSNHINQMVYSAKRDGQKLTEEQKALMSTIGESQRIGESRIQYLIRMKDAYNKLALSSDVFAKSSQKTRDMLNKLFSGRDYREALMELDDLLKVLDDDVENLTNEEKEVKLKADINKLASKKGWDDFMKELAYDAANRRFKVNIVPYVKTPTTQELTEWQKLYNDYFTKLQGGRFTPLDAAADGGKSQKDVIEQLKNDYMDTEDLLKRVEAASADAYPNEDAVKLQQKLNDLLVRGKYLGVDFAASQTNATKTQNEVYQERLRVLKDMHDKYKELQKDLSNSESQSLVATKFADAFATAFEGLPDFDINEIDWMSELGMEQALIRLLKTLPKTAKEARFAIQKELADIRGEVRLETKIADDKSLKQSIEDLFSGYELSLELDKLNIPKSFAQDFFNIEALSLPDLRSKVESMQHMFIGTEMEDEYKGYLNKIAELEDKAQQERLKKYVKYLVAGQGERVKIKLDEMRQIAEIESLPFDDAQKELAREAVRAEANKRIEKLDWEEFKDSGMYVRLFEDLEFASSRTLKMMREKLIELKSQLSDLDADDLKHLYDQIEKLDNELVERNPFKALAESADEYFKSLKRLKEAEVELSRAEDVEKGLASRVSDVDIKLSTEKNVYEQMSKSKDVTSEDLKKQREKITALNIQLAALKAQLLAQGRLTKELEEQIDAMAAGKRTFTGSAEEIGALISEAADALPQVAGHLENVFGAMSDGTRDTLDSIATIGGGIGDAIAGFASGNYVQAIMGVAQAIGGIFAAGDKAKERMIQRELKHVKELDKRYQEIDEALDNMYNARQMADYTKELSDNIDAQIADYERMRALEADKKKSDQEKMDEYDQAIEDLNKRREEMFAEQQSKATAGILDDALSAAEGFVDAWYEAFQETGDGLAGLENNFKEMLTNLIKKQAAMQIAGNFTKQYSGWLKEYINAETGDTELTAEEARLWAERVKATLPELSTLLENFFSGTQDLLQEQGELSELSKGIQGVTESTAQVLEALLNSMRFYVADSNVQLKNIANALISNDVEANPLLNELRQQTAMIRSIESMFDSVIGRGDSSHSGGYVKVLIG